MSVRTAKFRMKALEVYLLSVGIVWFLCGCAAAIDPGEGEVGKGAPFEHTYYWETFTLSSETPVSEDGRYRLGAVNSDGTVAVTYFPSPERPEALVVRPLSLRRGEPPQTVYIAEWDFQAQRATLRELRMK